MIVSVVRTVPPACFHHPVRTDGVASALGYGALVVVRRAGRASGLAGEDCPLVLRINSFAQCRSTYRFIFAHYSAWLLQSHHRDIRRTYTDIYRGTLWLGHCSMQSHITPTVVGVYRDWPGSSALNLYI